MILTVGVDHPRELIVQAVVALLAAANTAAGARVYPMRFAPFKKSDLPAIAVYAKNDPRDEDGSSEMEDGYELELEIVGVVPHTEAAPVGQRMNELARQIEAAMRSDPYLGGNASDVIHMGTEQEVVEEDGRTNPVVGIAVLTYAVKYHIALEAT